MEDNFSGLIFQEKNSTDLGLWVQYPLNLVHPVADLDPTHIKGRNGDFVQDNNSYQNVTETFTCVATKPTGVSQFDYERMIVDWLAPSLTDRKYQWLQFEYDQGYAFSAVQKDPINFQWDADDTSSAIVTIPFYCEPFQYRVNGIDYVPLPNSGTVRNEEAQIAIPNWHFVATGNFVLNVNGKPYEFDNMEGEFWLNGDTGDTYDKDNKLYNDQTKFPNLEVPILPPGENTISITAESGATITKAEYMPRWRRLI